MHKSERLYRQVADAKGSSGVEVFSIFEPGRLAVFIAG
jgi:hypothetical protein